MRTVVLGDHADFDELIARRRALGLDLHDEVWDGEYHVAAAPNRWHSIVGGELARVLSELARPRGLRLGLEFNLGTSERDFRVPDLGLHRIITAEDWVPTAAMVVEVVSPDDESWLKFDHYAAHGVDEVLIANPATSELWLFVLVDGRYELADASPLLGVVVADLHAAVDWPSTG